MSELNKGRLEVQKILRECIFEGLRAFGHMEEGNPEKKWDAMEFGQASFAKADKVITYNLRRSKRVGWQGRAYDVETSSMESNWIEEQRWQLEVILKRKGVVDVGEVLAEDVASDLIVWFNDKGCKWLRYKTNVSCIKIDSDNILIYNDDSSVYQKRAVFTIVLIVPKQIQIKEKFFDELTNDKFEGINP